MPHASRRLDLLVVAASPGQTVEAAHIQSLFHEWGLDEHGRVPKDTQVVDGGCARIWFDDPGRMVLYANQTGGFRSLCPSCGENIATAFGAAYLAWKRGSPRHVRCPTCTQVIPLEAVDLRPPGAFSSWAVVFSGVETADLTAEAKTALTRAIGDYQMVLRRP